MTTFSFQEQLTKGQDAERILDRHFIGKFHIIEATPAEQREGIDRWFVSRETAARFSVEYKTDWRAGDTHNAFVETISVDSSQKLGWVYTSKAYRILYFVPGDDLVYVFKTSSLRARVEIWSKTLPVRKAKNDGYWTHGVIVPLSEFERHAEFVLTVVGQ